MRKILVRWSVPCAILLLAIGGSWSTTSAQPAPWRINQGSNGTLYLLTGDTRYVVTPDAISDAGLATFNDGGVLGSQLLLPSPALVVAPAVPLPILAEPTAPVVVNTVPTVAPPPTPAAPAKPAALVLDSKGTRLTVLSIKRPSSVRIPFATPDYEPIEMTVRLDNSTDDLVSTNPLQFHIQGANLVIYDSTVGSVADALKCCDLAAHSSVVGRVFFELPKEMPQQTLIWQFPSIDPQQLDIR